jgi:hypothetical protein
MRGENEKRWVNIQISPLPAFMNNSSVIKIEIISMKKLPYIADIIKKYNHFFLSSNALFSAFFSAEKKKEGWRNVKWILICD